VADSCEHVNEPFVTKKDRLSRCHLSKKILLCEFAYVTGCENCHLALLICR
jgi:hypothetical protein